MRGHFSSISFPPSRLQDKDKRKACFGKWAQNSGMQIRVIHVEAPATSSIINSCADANIMD